MILTTFKKVISLLAGFLMMILVLLGVFYLGNSETNQLEVVYLDVGQGDSILIKSPYGQNILIDGGPNTKVVERLGKNLPFYEREIDLMILTHPHSDHVEGLVEVLKRYKVKKVLYTGVLHTSSDYLEWLEIIKEKNILLEIVKERQIIEFLPQEMNNKSQNSKFKTQDLNSKSKIINSKHQIPNSSSQLPDLMNEAEIFNPYLNLEILYPNRDFTNEKVENLNNSSIIARLNYGEVSFLFVGDAEIEQEEELLAQNISLEADILKIGHHGSNTSSSQRFLEVIQPSLAVIQVGINNKFDHPSLRIIKRLEKMGIQILRNDEDGEVRIVSDGEEWEVVSK